MRRVLTLFAAVLASCAADAGWAQAPKPVVAVLPFMGEGVGPAAPQLATQFLLGTLRDARELTLADPSTVLAAVQRISAGGKCTTDDCLMSVGRALPAAKLVVGTLVKDGGGTRMSLRGLDVATGQQIYAETRPLANENAALGMIATLSPALTAALVRPTVAAPTPPPATATSPSTTPLTIEHAPIATAEAGRALLIGARVQPRLGDHLLFVMHRKLGEPSFKLVRMSSRGDERYEGEIQPQAAGSTLEYCLRALDAAGRQAARFPEGADNVRVTISGAMTQPQTPPPGQIAASPSPPPSAKPRGGKKKWYWIGAGLAIGTGAYLASRGGDEPTPVPPVVLQPLPMPPPRP
jgi:hypothetical protein